MLSSSYKPPSRADFEEIALGGEVRAAVVAEAERAKAIAVGLSQDFRITGEYADSFEVTSETVTITTRGVGPHDVAAGRLTNISDYAAALEWGNEHAHRAHRVLGRTLDQLGS